MLDSVQQSPTLARGCLREATAFRRLTAFGGAMGLLLVGGCLHSEVDPATVAAPAPGPVSSSESIIVTTAPTTKSTTTATIKTATSTTATMPATTRATTRPATLAAKTRASRRHRYLLDDPQYAQNRFYFNLPATQSVRCGDFDAIWNQAQEVLRSRGFLADRLDYREGTLTSLPLSSKQFFEVWRNDITTVHNLEESSLASVRRTVEFQISKQPDAAYSCTVKVVVERQASGERRITDVTQYRDVFSTGRTIEGGMTDEDTAVQLEYWYAFRRDPLLEKRLADDLRARLAKQDCDD